MRNFLLKYYFALSLFLMASMTLMAQLPPISAPEIYTPTYRVYISTTGSDANDGSEANPVASFSKAIDLIPFNPSAHVYGEIVYKAGTYYPVQALIQSTSQFQSGSFTKNVSVVGEGEVKIYGDNLPEVSTILSLRGSHIRIQNIKLYNSKNSAIYLYNGVGSSVSRISDILIKDVFVDSTRSHGVMVRFVDRVLCENVTVTRGQAENTGVGGYCAWGSALRIEFGTHIKVTNCHTYHNRGEGINIAVSNQALVEHCSSYDNFAPNFYIIRANNVIFRNNLSYNQDSIYWRTCQPGTGAPLSEVTPTAGLSIANEVAYDDFPPGNICSPYRDVPGAYTIKMADSIFIYNNIFIMAPFYLIDESFGDIFCLNVHSNNFSNIFLENNTFIGDLSSTHEYQNKKALLTFIFNPNFFQGCLGGANTAAYRCENIVFKNNIVSNLKDNEDVDGTIHSISVLYGGRPCNGGSLGSKFTSSHNLWHHELPAIIDHFVAGSSTTVPNFFYNASTDVINEGLLTQCMPDDLNALRPHAIDNDNQFYFTAPVSAYITHDYFGQPRITGASNVGAVEYSSETSIDRLTGNGRLEIFPNPVNEQLHLKKSQINISNEEVKIVDLMGRVMPLDIKDNQDEYIINVSTFTKGTYILFVNIDGKSYSVKFTVL